MIIYDRNKQAEAIVRASELRDKNISVELVRITEERTREDCKRYAEKSGCMLVVEL